MAVETVKSASIANLDASPVVANTAGKGAAGEVQCVTDYATPSASASVGSKYLLTRHKSSAVIKNVWFESEAQAAGSFDIGAYYSDSTTDGTPAASVGAVIDADFFASVVDCSSAVRSDVTNESGNYPMSKRNQPLWQALGLSADPGGFIDIVATCVSVAVTTGTGKIGVNVYQTGA